MSNGGRVQVTNWKDFVTALSAQGGGEAGVGAATASNQVAEIARLTEIRDRLPTSGLASELTLAGIADLIDAQAAGTSDSPVHITVATLGQLARAASLGVALSAEDAQLLQTLVDRTPPLGQSDSDGSIPVVLSPDDGGRFLAIQNAIEAQALGTTADPARSVGFPERKAIALNATTSPYIGGDSIGGLLTIPNVFRNTSSGILLQRITYWAPVDAMTLRAVIFGRMPVLGVSADQIPIDNDPFIVTVASAVGTMPLSFALTRASAFGLYEYTADLGALPVRANGNTGLGVAIKIETGNVTFGPGATNGAIVISYTQE